MIFKSSYKYEAASLILSTKTFALVLADSTAPLNQQILQKFSIGTVISIGQQTVPKRKFPYVKYYEFHIRDQKTQSIIEYFDKVSTLIDSQLDKSGVLIHCQFGVSRSASFVLAHLMRTQNIGFQQAKAMVKQKRPCISPNPNFIEQLQKYELSLNHSSAKSQQHTKKFEQIKKDI